ncbi:MAG: nucleoside triphosphate pyrophosphohydrolase [Clostridia bacterium]|nr:nucleoside triphosphate pyrophosphohydrolase [Clostridia bacterium]
MAKIIIVGLGPGSEAGISMGTLEKLKSGKPVYFRTLKHPVIEKIKDWGITFQGLDHFYESSQFEMVYQRIVDFLLKEAKEKGEIIYGVPGSPQVAEDTVARLKKEGPAHNVEIEVLPALSFLDVLLPLLNIDPIEGLQIANGLETVGDISTDRGLIVCQVYNRLIASQVKLNLMEYYPDEVLVKVVRAAGVPGLERIAEVPLYEIDHLDWIDYLTTLYIPPCPGMKQRTKAQFPLDPLVEIMDRLLAPDGCPWDRKQTYNSLKRYVLEEAYEVVEAIDEKDMHKLCEELGDLLLQVVFNSALAARDKQFDINDVINGITEKMIRRHPHVFGNVTVSGAQEVLKNWEAIKNQEKGHEQSKSLLGTVPKDLPSLMHAYKVQEKAAKVGFDWPDIQGAWEKLEEELTELRRALEGKGKVYEELGDLLFAVVNVARFLDVNPEEALAAAVRKFRLRFSYIENKIAENGKTIKDYSLEQLDNWWEEAKVIIKNRK